MNTGIVLLALFIFLYLLILTILANVEKKFTPSPLKVDIPDNIEKQLTRIADQLEKQTKALEMQARAAEFRIYEDYNLPYRDEKD